MPNNPLKQLPAVSTITCRDQIKNWGIYYVARIQGNLRSRAMPLIWRSASSSAAPSARSSTRWSMISSCRSSVRSPVAWTSAITLSGCQSSVTATIAGRRQGAGRGLCLWQLHHRADQLPDHRLHPVPAGEGLEPHEEGRAAGTAAGRPPRRKCCSPKSATRLKKK